MPSKKSPAVSSKVLTLHVTLLYSNPPIWRRVEVPTKMTLGDLHNVMQIAMGWDDSHMHDFSTADKRYGSPHRSDAMFGEAPVNENRVQVGSVLKRKGSKLLYTYDFGDTWEHAIVVESLAEPEPGVQYPRCVAGERACPPEDCGGVFGYGEMLEALSDPDHEDYEMFREWVGEDFNPDAFDREVANAQLARVFKRRRSARK